MRKCLNPDCLAANPDKSLFCHQCGDKLLLRERYWAKRILGEGGFGRTFLAVDEDKPSKPPCVIKQFLPQAQGTANLAKAAELFAQEAQRLEELGKHPQIPELLANFTADNRQYLVQELIDGPTLQQGLEQNGVFSERAIRELLQDLLTVLQFVHQNQVIHRDIKPENIIRRASDHKLVLVDFGAAKCVKPVQRSVTGTAIGSAEYCAPEQAHGKPKFASDLYSLGVTCLHLLTQVSPFDLFDVMEAEWVWRDFLNGNSVSKELGQLLDRLVVTRPKQRYQSAAAVLTALNPPPPQPQSTATAPPPPPKQSPLRAVLSVFQPGLSPQGAAPAPQPATPKSAAKSKLVLPTFGFRTVRVDERGRIVEERDSTAEYFDEDLGDGVTLRMVAIPGGKFRMGSPKSELERLDMEGPQHDVTVSPFFFGEFPVTQAQWRVVATRGAKVERDLKPKPSNFSGSGQLPVERVSWDEAMEFCARLSKLTGRDYRLPSEAEWEYACRAKTTTPFHFGPTITPDLANYDGNNYTYGSGPKGTYRKKTTPRGTFKFANGFGLLDMHGNVWEWCADPWNHNYQGAPNDGTIWSSSDEENRRVLRGGSWFYFPWSCRSAFRSRFARDSRDNGVGFRVVCGAARTLPSSL
ncbi:MAG: SUMF1/EgtB/PvdO family nonheme iron enzyme, partial [Spirulinaceae cyanobacterium SM2_1_0]|nr:SUMF1/EgtB/PvdO family nonheme iron enzyme [Spirulinaceae cyanobacterium SM2_1_0]